MKTFKAKLMLFCSLLCLGVILAVWFFSAFLMEPAYESMLRGELENKLSTAVTILQKEGLTLDNYTQLQELVREGMCLDISNITTALQDRLMHGQLVQEGIANCELHSTPGSDIDFIQKVAHADTETAYMMRKMVMEKGSVDLITKSGSQMILGRRTVQGYTVIISASLARVSEATAFIQKFLGWLTVILVPLVLGISYVFSWLFTRPVSRLSRAARQMAGGDYAIALPAAGKDEIGILTDDFNRMAVEVARTDRLQKDLVANISHDLRTPLTLMKGYAETIRDLTGEDKKKRNEQLGIIIDESDRLSGLVNSVLELSRLEAGTEKLEPVTFDLCDFCEELTYRYTDACEKNGYTLRLDAPSEERLVSADPALMQRVLHNLLSNAFAHIGADNEIVLSVQDVSPGVRVTIEDHGKGIAPEDAERVFQRYYRARSDNGKPGAGLGLSIVRAILESHGFAYGVDSTPGEGAKFWFEMPCRKPENAKNAEASRKE